MSKQSKKATKRKKTERQLKKKKKAKKLGLAKFVPKQTPFNKKDVKSSQPETEEEERERLKKMKEKADVIRSIKKQQRSLSLVDRCKLQMSSSLLRLIDEKLYTSDTKQIPLSKDEFMAYHDAYSQVCDKWPTKPIDYLVKFIKKRLLTKRPLNKWKFADIGCGKEPLLKKSLPSKACVKSFDLISAHEDVIEANMDNLPLDNDSINCAVYSLSLMAKNLSSILLEAKRVLKEGGSLLIVEVTSRFEGRTKRFVQKLERIGFKKQSMSELKPNGYFTFFHFTKADNELSYQPSSTNIELKPCVYKAR